MSLYVLIISITWHTLSISQNLYKQLLKVSRQWRDLRNRMQSGLGHQQEDESPSDGSMAIFCPACPQPGINLPEDWKTKYTLYGISKYIGACMLTFQRKQLIRTFIMDGNFSAEHMRCRTGASDVPLSAGMAFMANPDSYKDHLSNGQEIAQVSAYYICH